MKVGGVVTPHGSLRIAVHKELWILWVRVALGHRDQAREARRNNSQTHDAETRAGIVAIVACAAALDSFYAETAARVALPQTTERTERSARIESALFAGFRISGEHDALAKLFATRDAAVHAKALGAETISNHPGGGRESDHLIEYALERVEESIDLVLQILSAAAEPGAASSGRVERWIDPRRRVIARLVAEGL